MAKHSRSSYLLPLAAARLVEARAAGLVAAKAAARAAREEERVAAARGVA